jgi:protein-disulfide isomerase
MKTIILTGILALMCTVIDAGAQTSGSTIASSPNNRVPQIEIFCDFRCPFCARLFNSLLPSAMVEHRQLNLRFRHFTFHAGSQELARFFEAARLQDPSIDLTLIGSLYRYQRQVDATNLLAVETALATLHGLDGSRLARDLDARDVALAIREDEKDAVAAGVDATPTVFANGKPLTGEPEEIARAILILSPQIETRASDLVDQPCLLCAK